MKILVLLPDSPDPWSNTAARYYAPMLKGLVTMGDDVTALAIRRKPRGEEDLSYFAGLEIRLQLFDPAPARPFLERKLRSFWRSGWELAVSDFGRAARRQAERDYDVILAEMPQTARVVEQDTRTVLSLHYLHSVDLTPFDDERWRAFSRERWQARRAELSTCRAVPRIRAISNRLACLLRDHDVSTPVTVVPICLDLALYEPVGPPEQVTVGVVGSMFWAPSRRAALHFIRHLVPRVRRRLPEARFLVAGWQAGRYLSEAARGAGVEVVDSFPDPRDVFARLSVLVYAPPIGTGMKVKVLEAMAYGVPVVTNAEGFEGLDADLAPPVVLAQSDDELEAGILALGEDSWRRRQVIAEGRACLDRSFSPAVVVEKLRRVFQENGSVGPGAMRGMRPRSAIAEE